MFRFSCRSRLVAAFAGASPIAIAIAAPSAIAQEQVRRFDIPAQSLSSALIEYSRQAGVDVTVSSELVGDRQAPAVVGVMTPNAALSRLLQGSGLTVRQGAAGMLTLARVESPTSPQTLDTASRAASSNDEPNPADRVVVTGSRIAGAPQTAMVTTIGREDFEQAGFVDIGQAIRSLPGNFSGGLNPEATLANIPIDGSPSNRVGLSSANLLGLGASATLTLLDGNRLPATGEGLAVDLSLIPAVAMERMEVLADGASAIYGTDAVAGVVNVITRRDFRGLEARVRGGSAEGGLETYTGSMLAGGSIGPAHGLIGVEYMDQSELQASKRIRSADMLPPRTLFGDTERTSVFASGEYELGERARLNATGLYMQRFEEGVNRQPTQLAFGHRKAAQYALSAGLNLDVGKSWGVEIIATTNRSVAKNPVRIFDDTRGWVASFFDRRNELLSIEARTAGNVVDLPAGPLKLATGGAYREESLRSRQTTVRGSERQVTSAYAELSLPLVGPAMNVPLVHALGVTAAGRYDDYSDVGAVSVPKVGLRWDVVPSLALTANYSESFRAPSPFENSTSYFAALNTVTDTSGTTRIMYIGGTGAQLSPERSENRNLGFTYTPDWLNDFTLSATYFDIDYTGRIANPDPTNVFLFDMRGAPDVLVTRNPSLAQLNALAAASNIAYAVDGVFDLSAVQAIVDMRNTNISATQVAGFQASASYGSTFAGGDLNLMLDVTYLDHMRNTLRPDSPPTDRADTIFSPPDWRARTGASWTSGRWTGTLFWNYVDDYVDNRVTGSPLAVKSWNTLDASLGIDLSGFGLVQTKDIRLVFSATNLLDQDPPSIVPNRFSPATWDAANASIVGRFISAELVARW